MKRIIHLGKRWLKKSPGFTLAELMVAMTIGGFIVTSVLAVWTQLFLVTAANSNYMAAFRQVQNGGDWISRDSLTAQAVYAMPSTMPELSSGISDSQSTITVDSTDAFPPTGIICIEDELICYSSKTATQFTVFDDPGTPGVVDGRGYSGTTAANHTINTPVTFLVALTWTDWAGDHHQIVYNIIESPRHLMRTYLTKGSSETSYTLVNSTMIAEGIEPDSASTSSQWDYDEKELTVMITARVGDKTATRTYGIHPRPLF